MEPTRLKSFRTVHGRFLRLTSRWYLTTSLKALRINEAGTFFDLEVFADGVTAS